MRYLIALALTAATLFSHAVKADDADTEDKMIEVAATISLYAIQCGTVPANVQHTVNMVISAVGQGKVMIRMVTVDETRRRVGNIKWCELIGQAVGAGPPRAQDFTT